MNTPTLTIDVVSDVVCPWCYIGKRKLESALALPDAASLPNVVIRWHPFQLKIAEEAGLNGAAARTFVNDPEQLATVVQAAAHSRSLGISAVPFFIFNQKVSVSGAQDPATLLGAMQPAVAGKDSKLG